MSILVYPHSEQEERELLAFLKDRQYQYKTDQEIDDDYLTEYNNELKAAEAEIDAGVYMTHEAVKELFKSRSK